MIEVGNALATGGKGLRRIVITATLFTLPPSAFALGPPGLVPSPAQSPAPEVAPATIKLSADAWLKRGEAYERSGEFSQAGEAYRQALDAFSDKTQRADEGARAALLSADAHLQAFEHDTDLVHLEHLDASVDVLEYWLKLTGPQSPSTKFDEVQRKATGLRAVHDPLAAVLAGNLAPTSDPYRAMLDALAQQRPDGSVLAAVALRVAGIFAAAYAANVHSADDIDLHLHELRIAAEILEHAIARSPEDSARRPILEQRLAELRTQIEGEQHKQRDHDAEQARTQAELAAATQRQPAPAPPPAVVDAPRHRTLSIALVSAGAVATLAGAAMLGEGVAFARRSEEQAESAADEADALEEMYGQGFDRATFESDIEAYEADTQSRNQGMIIGGSVVMTAGIAATVTGIVLLMKGRRSPQLLPWISPTRAQLSFSTKF